MPLPAILAGAAAVLSAAMVVDNLLTGGRVSDAVGKRAAQAVLDARGIPLDLDGEVSQQTITQAINVAVMPDGVTFENLFDKLAVKRDVKRMALAYAAESFGFEGSSDPDVLKKKIIEDVMREVRQDIAAGQGEYVDAAKGLALVQRVIDKPEPFDWQKVRNFSNKAEKNRERQERWRASNKRKWVEK